MTTGVFLRLDAGVDGDSRLGAPGDSRPDRRGAHTLRLSGRDRFLDALRRLRDCRSALPRPNVLSATESAEVHPGYPASGIVSGAASLILPGWGQILNGHRVRAMVFLASMLSLVGFGTHRPNRRSRVAGAVRTRPPVLGELRRRPHAALDDSAAAVGSRGVRRCGERERATPGSARTARSALVGSHRARDAHLPARPLRDGAALGGPPGRGALGLTARLLAGTPGRKPCRSESSDCPTWASPPFSML